MLQMVCDHEFEPLRDGWACHHCGLIPPACFTPKPEAIYQSDEAFVAKHFVIIHVGE